MYMDKIHLGCGNIFVKGWLNIGLFEEGEFPSGKVIEKEGAWILNQDILKEIDIELGSIKQIYSSHFIEHLELKNHIKILSRCYKYLEAGGIIRISFPNLEFIAKRYVNGDDVSTSDSFIQFKKKYGFEPTKGLVFMNSCKEWGHKWMYDFESVKLLLELAGFKKVMRKGFRESEILDIDDLEPLDREDVSVYIEAKK